jgi:hypothetical protein
MLELDEIFKLSSQFNNAGNCTLHVADQPLWSRCDITVYYRVILNYCRAFHL